MASAGDAIDEAAAGAETTMAKRTKRISDCLVDSDGPDDAPPSPGTPRLRIPMFTCARLRFGGRKAGGRRKEAAAAAAAAEKSEEGASVDSSAGWKVASSGASSAEAAAGMGLGLLFLLAKTCAELKKMAEVRAQMEALLDEMRGQLAAARTTKLTSAGDDNNHAAARGRTRAGAAASSSSRSHRPRRHSRRRDYQGRERRGEPSPSPFYAMTGNPLFDDLDREPCGRAAAADSSSAMETASGESESGATTAEVETAGATSMAGQFQHNRDTNLETSEWSSSSDGEFIELDGGFFGGGGDRRGDYAQEHRAESEGERAGVGVSALEVERRLQEILHRRSQERIEELESALRRAERKLVEKEMEARLWKDTAKLCQTLRI